MGRCPKPRQRSAAGSRPPGRALALGVWLSWVIRYCGHMFEYQYAWHVYRSNTCAFTGLLNRLIGQFAMPSGGSDPTAARWRGLGWNPIASLVFHHLNATLQHNLPRCTDLARGSGGRSSLASQNVFHPIHMSITCNDAPRHCQA